MPLHKSTRAPRLDPTMISAPLGDFRHTMHIGRGGDAFGDTSFLSTLGPGQASSDVGSPPAVAPPDEAEEAMTVNHSDGSELQHSESVSSFTLDLDFDLGPSMLGEVLGVMDGLGLEEEEEEEEDVFSPKSGGDSSQSKPGNGATETSVNLQNEKNSVGLDGNQVGDSRIPDGNGIKPKGLKPKVRFSDKREEIIRQASEEDEGQNFDFQDESEPVCLTEAEGERGETRAAPTAPEGDTVNHKEDLPPSPASSHSSEYDGAIPLDRRRVDNCQSETDSEEEDEEEEDEEEEGEEGEAGRGYTFEDEFDDEIGL